MICKRLQMGIRMESVEPWRAVTSHNLRDPIDLFTATFLRRWAYAIAALLGVAYGIYVVAMKLSARVTSGPLGELGEFFLVLASVTALSIGLFADEVLMRRKLFNKPKQETK